ncbi:MAG: Uma2 family endonuclease [Oscillatoriales cyanobacterium RM2_1_1]|nr:Uma2 family endonuclease [Oscillatoriales cyanobacterium SM2_3_0]NJO47501.1 Uma2 family endonuclease [Oscillatoriales cyanobacterium RM2_1_1]
MIEQLQAGSEFVEIEYPPCNLESQEPPLETELHLRQIILLIQMLEYLWQDRQDFYAFGNLTIYYSLNQKKSEEFRGPDFFVVLDTERKTRKSWTVWEEGGKYPHVIIELLSDSTQKVDREEKRHIYQDVFRTPEYFWFSPDTLEFKGLALVDWHYQEIQPNENGWFWSKQLELFLGIHEGKLRFITPEGEMAPTPQEVAQLEKQQRAIAEQKAQRAEQQLETEHQQKEAAERQNEILKAKLRELNIDPDTL